MLVTSLRASALVVVLLALAGCNGLPAQYCETGAACDDFAGLLLDPVPGDSDDSADVCAVNQQTVLSALRANSEQICHDMALAYENWMACAIEEGCDAFEINQPECKDELEEYRELQDDAGNRCNE